MPVRWKAASPPFAPFVLIVQLNSQFSEHPRIQSYCYHLFSDRPVKPKQAINVEWNRPDFRRIMTIIRLQNICLKLKNVRFIIFYLLLTHFRVLFINLYCTFYIKKQDGIFCWKNIDLGCIIITRDSRQISESLSINAVFLN